MHSVARYWEVLGKLTQAAKELDASLAQQLLRLRKLHYAQRFRVDEALPWRITDPAIADRDLDRYLSRSHAMNLKLRVNAPAEPETTDKARFYLLCRERGIPGPGMFGVLAGHDVERPACEAAPRVRLEDLPDGDFVAKPSHGQEGKGVLFFRKDGAHYVLEGTERSAAAMGERFRAFAGRRDYVVQRRLVPHPGPAAVSGSRGLQCVRIVTYVDGRGGVHMLFARFKFLGQANLIDNFNLGVTGNHIAEVDLDSGRIVKALAKQEGKLLLQPVEQHPATGRSLHITLPFWTEVLDLARSAAEAFASQRTLGWDIALTSTGPLIVEGNNNWEPFPMGPLRKPEPLGEWETLLRP